MKTKIRVEAQVEAFVKSLGRQMIADFMVGFLDASQDVPHEP